MERCINAKTKYINIVIFFNIYIFFTILGHDKLIKLWFTCALHWIDVL